MNYQHMAVKLGDLLKYDTTLNLIERYASAILRIPQEKFPNDAITSARAKSLYDWILSLAKASLEQEERDRRLVAFLKELFPKDHWLHAEKLLAEEGVAENLLNRDNYRAFVSRHFHEAVIRHSQSLFIEGDYFHAVFEAAKAYTKAVQEKSHSTQDGQPLMFKVWGIEGCPSYPPAS